MRKEDLTNIMDVLDFYTEDRNLSYDEKVKFMNTIDRIFDGQSVIVISDPEYYTFDDEVSSLIGADSNGIIEYQNDDEELKIEMLKGRIAAACIQPDFHCNGAEMYAILGSDWDLVKDHIVEL